MRKSPGIILSGNEAPAILGPAFWSAIQWVSEAHKDQCRKGKPKVPYVSHLLGVASLVLEAGGTETEAIAALLHDAVEDQDITLEEIRSRYGTRVEKIVAGCTDSHAVPGDDPETPSPPHGARANRPVRNAANWHKRKQASLAHLKKEQDAGILLVSGADKLHNARAIVADLHTGRPAWTQFNAPPTDQLWYYRSLRDVLSHRIPAYLGRELRTAVDEIVRLTNVAVETVAWRKAHPK